MRDGHGSDGDLDALEALWVEPVRSTAGDRVDLRRRRAGV